MQGHISVNILEITKYANLHNPKIPLNLLVEFDLPRQ